MSFLNGGAREDGVDVNVAEKYNLFWEAVVQMTGGIMREVQSFRRHCHNHWQQFPVLSLLPCLSGEENHIVFLGSTVLNKPFKTQETAVHTETTSYNFYLNWFKWFSFPSLLLTPRHRTLWVKEMAGLRFPRKIFFRPSSSHLYHRYVSILWFSFYHYIFFEIYI